MQVAHMGLRDGDVDRQVGVNLSVGGVVLLAPPANAHDHIVPIGRARKRHPLCLGGEQAQGCTLTRRVGTAPRSAGYREDATQGLHGLVPCQIVAQHQQVTAVGTGEEFGLINDTLLSVSCLRGSHGHLHARVLSTLAELKERFLVHDNPISLTALVLRYCDWTMRSMIPAGPSHPQSSGCTERTGHLRTTQLHHAATPDRLSWWV